MTNPGAGSTTEADKSILMLCWNFPPAVGGIEAVASNLRDQLVEQGRAVSVIARYAENLVDGAAVSRPTTPGLFRYLLFALFRGRKVLKKENIRLIVCPGIVDAPVGWLLSRWFKIPYVVLAHGTDLVREGAVYRAITRFFFQRAEGVAANSNHTRDLLVEAGVRIERIRVIHPGVRLDFPNTESSTPELNNILGTSTGPVLMTVGRVIRRKGIGPFIEHVLPELIHSVSDLQYVVVGGDASDSLAHPERLLDELQEQTNKLGLQDYVAFTGKVSDSLLHALLQRADLLVFPVIPVTGDVEGFGIVVLEGAAHGAPAVASRTGGIPDAVDDGRSGILVQAEDWDSMRTTIAGLLENPDQLATMGSYARERAHREFSWPVIARHYATFFDDVCAVVWR